MSLSPPTPAVLRPPISIRRELIILVAAIAFGLFAVPPLLWVVGSRTLGPYAGGGVGAIMTGFFRGLGTGSFGFWMAALGPYLITLVVRALSGLLRAGKGD